MPPNSFQYLLNVVGPAIAKKKTKLRKTISPAERLCLTIHYLAYGDSQQTTISGIINETCATILFFFFSGGGGGEGGWGSLKGKHVRSPQTPEAWKAIAKDFQEIWNLQHCIGVVGGKHVAIKSPLNSDNNNDSGAFRNSKMREQFFENKVHLPAADGSKIEGKFNK